MSSFKDILAKPIEEIKSPPPVPMGTYDWRVKGHEFGQSNQKKTDYVRFLVQAIAAGDDVDDSQLAEIGGVEACEMRLTFYITEDAAFRLREFLEKDLGLSGPTLEALIPQATNAVFRGYVSQQVNAETGKPFSELKKTMKAA
jgi:hypothetical protein